MSIRDVFYYAITVSIKERASIRDLVYYTIREYERIGEYDKILIGDLFCYAIVLL